MMGFGSRAQATPVDLALSLVIDISGSISSSEYALQMQGYANAFRIRLYRNLLRSTYGESAVNVVFFDSIYRTSALENFTILDAVSEINTFADTIEGFGRLSNGSAAIHTGVNRALDLMLAAVGTGGTLEGTANLVIDVSGDGTGNANQNLAARSRAEANGVTINRLANGGSSIVNHYTNTVITSDGFVQPTSGFDDFNLAVLEKLRIESGTIMPSVSEPSLYALFGIGLIGLCIMRRRIS